MRSLLIAMSLLICTDIFAQELFTYSEPASNMPVKSFAIRANTYALRQNATRKYTYSFAPEIMVGISKKLMLHGEAFFGNEGAGFDGASVYFKYRFLSYDEVHSHFRMALYGKVSGSDNVISQAAIDLSGRNSGSELGIVATKLMHKIAVSAGGSFVHAYDNSHGNKFDVGSSFKNALSYNVSIGKLFLPVEYKDYGQTNLNVMIEFIGQTNLGNGHTYIDIAPSLQLIFLSKIRLDAGYRVPLINSLSRTADRGCLLRVEYNFFSAF